MQKIVGKMFPEQGYRDDLKGAHTEACSLNIFREMSKSDASSAAHNATAPTGQHTDESTNQQPGNGGTQASDARRAHKKKSHRDLRCHVVRFLGVEYVAKPGHGAAQADMERALLMNKPLPESSLV